MPESTTTTAAPTTGTVAPAATAAPKEKKTRGAVTADADLTAMTRISGIINSLDTSDRARVLKHVIGKYGAEVKS